MMVSVWERSGFSDMKRLILHVGTMKTGTSAIQGFLAQNAAVLERQGVSYPLFGRFAKENPDRNANFLMRAANARAVPGYKSKHLKKKVPAALAEFREAVAAFDTVVLSEETLWHRGLDHEGYWEAARAIVEECGVEQTDVIVYLRRQDEYAESRWREFVKHHTWYTMTFEEYRADEESMRPNDYKRGVDLLAAAFGKDRLTVRVYERSGFVDHDVVKDFLACAGIGDDPGFDYVLHGSRARNSSLSEDYTELKRLANLAPAYSGGGSNWYRAAATAAMGALDGIESKWHMSSEERAAFMARYEEGNAALAREYLGREDGVLFSNPAADGDAGWDYDPARLLRESVVLYAEALARERQARERDAKRLKELERRVAELERAQRDRGTGVLLDRLRGKRA